jgi:tripartite-type tricarboxylate transporter receptor subunit TctC
MRKLLTALALSTAIAAPAWADGFFEGKTITYIIATSPGGNYDAYARLIGKQLEERLGADKIVFKNLPGAGHIIGANTLAASKPDGLTIGTFNTGLIYAQILEQEGINFDLRQMSWIGKAEADARVIVVSEDSGLKDFGDLLNLNGPVNFSTSGVGSASFTESKLLKDAFDLKIELIPGYKGNEGEMAMLRGEVVGQLASFASIKPFVDAGSGHTIVSVGGDIEPQAITFAEGDRAKAIVNLIQAMSTLGRLTAAPPGVPDDVLQELRTAYMDVMQDPAFLTEAERLGLPIEPESGEHVEQKVFAALNQTPETVKLIASALDVEVPSITVTSAILSLADKNKVMEFHSGDAVIKSKISGSRTAITINGASGDRGGLKVGMACEIAFDPTNEDFEPSSMNCDG